MLQHFTASVVASARTRHCHAVAGVGAAILRRVQLKTEAAQERESEVLLPLALIAHAVNSGSWSAGVVVRPAVAAVVVKCTDDAVGG